MFSGTRESSQNCAVTAKIGARKSCKVDEAAAQDCRGQSEPAAEGDPSPGRNPTKWTKWRQTRFFYFKCARHIQLVQLPERKIQQHVRGTCGHGAEEAVTRDKPDVTSVRLGFAAPPAEARRLYAIAPDCGSQSLAFARCLTSDSLKSLLNGQGFSGASERGA
jgi:hypothetical protein